MSVEQVVNFLWKTIINWAVQPRLNTLPTLLAGPARTNEEEECRSYRSTTECTYHTYTKEVYSEIGDWK